MNPKNKALVKWLFLVFSTSVWMFILGIWVGRGTAPVTFDTKTLLKELVELKQTLIKQEHNSYQVDSSAKNGTKGLDFYEALKKTDDLNDDRHLQSDLPKQKKAELSQKQPPEQKQVLVEEKTWTPKKDEPLKSVAGEKDNKKYTIQVASLKDADSADNMVSDLKKRGYPAYRSLTKIPGKGIWFRVRIGNFNNHEDAGETVGRLKKDNISAIVVSN
jgi:cell division septation protein DedD